jgi:lipid-A-disaccharide synthase
LKTVFIAAGEASGDLHAANLIRALKARHGGLRFLGLGGEQMRQAGAELLYDLRSLAVAGFWEVARQILHFRRIYRDALEAVDREKPALAILVDYPGMNLRLAKQLRKRGIRVVYYIVPQVWAWKPKRITQIEERVNLLLSILPFEKQLFDPDRIQCEFVGHPLLDLVHFSEDSGLFRSRLGISTQARIVALLPGSRATEIERHYPVMLEAVKLLVESGVEICPVVLVRDEVDSSLYEDAERASNQSPIHLADDRYELLRAAEVSIVTSGTATLEAALCGRPFCVVYRTGWITYQIARRVINLQNVGLVNIVAGETVVPEYLQQQMNAGKLSAFCRQVLTDGKYALTIMEKLKSLRGRLGEPGAAQRAAELIEQELIR